MHLHPETMRVLTAAVDEGFQSITAVIPKLPVTAGTPGVDIASGPLEAFDLLHLQPPQGEVPQGCAVFPRATGAMPVHRRGRESPFCSMCVMCGAVTWRGR